MPQSIRWLVIVGWMCAAGSAVAQPPTSNDAVPGTPAGAAPTAEQEATPGATLPAAAPSVTGADFAPTATTPAVEGEGPVDEESPRVKARAAYDRGQAAFATRDYERALSEFQTAYRILPNPVVLRSMAKSEERLGRISDAIAHLSAFLNALPDHPERPQVEHELSELRRRPGTLSLAIVPEDAVIQVDDRPAALRSGAMIQLSPGPHLVTMSRDGHERVLREIEVIPGAHQELRLELPPTPEDVSENAVIADGQSHAAIWVAGGIGVAGLATGTVLGFLALSENSDFDADPTAASADRGERLALFADVAFGVAAMATVTAAVLYLTAEEPEPATTASVQWGVTPLPGGAAASASFRY